MDLKPYIRPILKWWWMLVLAGLIAGASSLVITMRQPPIYQAHTTLMIGQTINDPNPAQNLRRVTRLPVPPPARCHPE